MWSYSSVVPTEEEVETRGWKGQDSVALSLLAAAERWRRRLLRRELGVGGGLLFLESPLGSLKDPFFLPSRRTDPSSFFFFFPLV